MELDLGDLLSDSLLECCEFHPEEDEHTIDSFLLSALDAYEHEYVSAPAQPIEQPHPLSAKPGRYFTVSSLTLRLLSWASWLGKAIPFSSRV